MPSSSPVGLSGASRLPAPARATESEAPHETRSAAQDAAPLKTRNSKDGSQPRRSAKVSTGPTLRQVAMGVLGGVAAVQQLGSASAASAARPGAIGLHGGPGAAGIAPGIPYQYEQSLQTPLADLAAHFIANPGQMDGDPHAVKDSLFKRQWRHGYTLQLDARALEDAMKTFKPEVVDQALTLGSFCGHTERTMEDALRKCLWDNVRKCMKLNAAGGVVQGATAEDCKPYTPLGTKVANLANIARLAVLKSTASDVDHRYSEPFLHGPKAVMSDFGGAFSLGEAAARPGQSGYKIGAIAMVNEAALRSRPDIGADDLALVRALVHELHHALFDDRLQMAIERSPTLAPIAGQLKEFAVEFATSHVVTMNATDSPHEYKRGGNDFMLRALQHMTGVDRLTNEAYQAGMQHFLNAFRHGDTNAVRDVVNSLEYMAEQYRTGAWKIPTQPQQADSRAAVEPSTSTTPPPSQTGPSTRTKPAVQSTEGVTRQEARHEGAENFSRPSSTLKAGLAVTGTLAVAEMVRRRMRGAGDAGAPTRGGGDTTSPSASFAQSGAAERREAPTATPDLVYSLRPEKINKRIAGLHEDTKEVLKLLVGLDGANLDGTAMREAVRACTGFAEKKLDRCFEQLKSQELFIGNRFASDVARKQAENKLFQGHQLDALRAELAKDSQGSSR